MQKKSETRQSSQWRKKRGEIAIAKEERTRFDMMDWKKMKTWLHLERWRE
ncbi:uncharacterized protein G2W53_016921 [Senna tora]|uniref:Uncharacterized protein n=1 Tax=Senna tora TaxID=362788 RepID=A0A834WJZ4_9FABA|nr:uncharacterized protein G2W53_016921 [Senna tora]